jgi:hypothetical protein
MMINFSFFLANITDLGSLGLEALKSLQNFVFSGFKNFFENGMFYFFFKLPKWCAPFSIKIACNFSLIDEIIPPDDLNIFGFIIYILNNLLT